jgi:acyl-coenzyme A thioesterase PaaI-like protein
MIEERIILPKLQGHYCFACGTENPIGLNLKFYRSGETVRTDITLGQYHEGWQNMAHGGIITTLVDETMSWTIMYFKRVFFVTRKIEIKYVKPVLIGTPITVIGRIKEKAKPPLIRANAEIRDDRGGLLVRGGGEFVEVPQEKLASVPDGLKADMQALYDQF